MATKRIRNWSGLALRRFMFVQRQVRNVVTADVPDVWLVWRDCPGGCA